MFVPSSLPLHVLRVLFDDEALAALGAVGVVDGAAVARASHRPELEGHNRPVSENLLQLQLYLLPVFRQHPLPARRNGRMKSQHDHNAKLSGGLRALPQLIGQFIDLLLHALRY